MDHKASIFTKHVLLGSERALVASQIAVTSPPALDLSSMSRWARSSAVGGHECSCSSLRVLSGCLRPYAVRTPCGISGRLCATSAVLRGGNVSITG